MRVLCIGGGPAGLYTGLLLRKADPRNVVRVVERNRPYDTFGWGVVFSDQTLGNLAAADPVTAGEIAGAFNRFLRWDAAQMVDSLDEFSLPLHVHDGDGSAAPKSGYPTKGDRFDGELPVVVDVTPRRLQAFRVMPGERVGWVFGEDRGEVIADERGAITMRGLALELEWQTLVLSRLPAVP